MSQQIDSLRTLLVQHYMRIRDGDQMRGANEQLVTELARLSKCMRDFNATHGADDPELGLDGEALEGAQEVERQAEGADRTVRAVKALDMMHKAYASDIRAIRLKRQLHDGLLAKAAVPEELENELEQGMIVPAS
ncbi:hypothetical protein ACVIGB_008339 [Bradyrhizobium sp. USDA 4341]